MIGKGGDFSINEKCVEHLIKDCSHAEMYYDDVTNKIGLKPMKEETEFSYPIHRKSKSKYVVIHGRGFLKYFRLTIEAKATYAAKWNAKEKLIELELKEVLPFNIKETYNPSPSTAKYGKDLEL
jgi:hypothetical protein